MDRGRNTTLKRIPAFTHASYAPHAQRIPVAMFSLEYRPTKCPTTASKPSTRTQLASLLAISRSSSTETWLALRTTRRQTLTLRRRLKSYFATSRERSRPTCWTEPTTLSTLTVLQRQIPNLQVLQANSTQRAQLLSPVP